MRSGYSYDEIAADMGYASRSSAWRLVTNALKSTVDDVAEDYLQGELERLDALQVAIWHSAMAGDIASANVLLRIIAQRVRLLGLEKSKPDAGRPRTVVDVEAHGAYMRNEERNHGAD